MATITGRVFRTGRKVLVNAVRSPDLQTSCVPGIARSSLLHSSYNKPFQTQKCHYSRLPMNTVLLFVPQQEAWVIERMGKYLKILEPGLNILIPVLDSVKYVQILKEQAIKIPEQSAVTKDNVGLHIDGVLYVKVVDAYKASYGVEDPEYAVTQLAQTTMRSEIGKLTLDGIFRERELLNTNIVMAINNASEDAWGIQCLRYEIRDIQVPKRVQEAMQMQVEAERKKRAAVLESEGKKEADINVAEGKRQAQILASEAEKIEKINQAEGDAKATIARAEARARSITVVSESLQQRHGTGAAGLSIAEQYVQAFGNIAQKGNTILLPSHTGDVSSMVSQALAIYKNLSSTSQTSEAVKQELPLDEKVAAETPEKIDQTKIEDT